MENGLYNMISDSWKNAFKMASKDPQEKIVKKIPKTLNCLHSLAFSKAFTIHPKKMLKPFFLIFSFS